MALVALVPARLVAATSPAPSHAGGLVATIWVAVWVVIVAALAPNLTAVAPPRFVPVIVTLVPPVVGPASGLTVVTTGRGGFTVAVALALSVEPPTSLIVIVVVNGPVLEYVWVP